MSAGRLAQLVLSLEEVSLLFTQLTTEQLSVLLTALGNSEGLKLRRLNLTRNDLSSVPSPLLSRAVLRLEEATLFMTKLSRDQVNGISRAVISQKISLKKLGVSHNNLSFVSAELLAQAVIRLEEVELRGTGLDHQQMLLVCWAIEDCPAPELRLRRLNIRSEAGLHVDLEHHLSKAEKKLASFRA